MNRSPSTTCTSSWPSAAGIESDPSPMRSIRRRLTWLPVNSSDVAPRAAPGGMPTAAANAWGVSCTCNSHRGCQGGGASAPRNRAWIAIRMSSACAAMIAARADEVPTTRKLLGIESVGEAALAPHHMKTRSRGTWQRNASRRSGASIACKRTPPGSPETPPDQQWEHTACQDLRTGVLDVADR